MACVGELYAIDGSCGTEPSQLDPTFGHFTALPVPNDYEATCETSSPGSTCDGSPEALRFTTDAAGNALVPFDYRGVLVRSGIRSIPRLVRGSSTFPAFDGTPQSVRIPGAPVLSSFSPRGHRLPPLFTPLADADPVTGPGGQALFGSVDAPLAVMRIARQACLG